MPPFLNGDYRPLLVQHEQLAFLRQDGNERVLVAVNAARQAVPLDVALPVDGSRPLVDLLNPGETFPVCNERAQIDAVWPCWARILTVQ